MQVQPERLPGHLARTGLQHVYLVYGAEPLQAQEAADAIRAAGRAAGVAERLIFDATGQAMDWAAVRGAAGALSLFADRRLLEVRLGTRKPDKAGAATLLELAENPANEDVLLIIADALDRTQQQAPWYLACEKRGVVVACREPAPAEFRNWLAKRARDRGLELSLEACDYLAIRAEGNLLAAAQEIEKLVLVVPPGALGLDVLLGAVTDNARYDSFQCVDAALAGDAARAVRIVRGLREEGTEPLVIGWSLNRELRTLTRVAAARACGVELGQAMSDQKVWSNRQGLVRAALQRLPLARLAALLDASIELDMLIKGRGIGDPWDALETLLAAVAGMPWLGRQSAVS
jgi:DNA polymerase-3 subunit delta